MLPNTQTNRKPKGPLRMDAKHTPLPWEHSGNQIVSGATEICEMEEIYIIGERRANADLIVKAVNCHDDLIAALQACFDAMSRGMGIEDAHDSICEQARAAIAKATSASAAA